MNTRDMPVFVTVTSEMETAGLQELFEAGIGGDASHLVSSIYMAMEYQRLASLGELGPVTDEAIQILKSQG